MMISNPVNDEQYSEELKCTNSHRLKQWEIRRYHEAVEAHRTALSRKAGEVVEWRKAERDFLVNNYAVMAEKSRADFCSLICPKRNSCLMAQGLVPVPQRSIRRAA